MRKMVDISYQYGRYYDAKLMCIFHCFTDNVSYLDFNVFVYIHFHQQLRKVAHEGCVNRIRAMQQNPHICASWADGGHVQVRLDL